MSRHSTTAAGRASSRSGGGEAATGFVRMNPIGSSSTTPPSRVRNGDSEAASGAQHAGNEDFLKPYLPPPSAVATKLLMVIGVVGGVYLPRRKDRSIPAVACRVYTVFVVLVLVTSSPAYILEGFYGGKAAGLSKSDAMENALLCIDTVTCIASIPGLVITYVCQLVIFRALRDGYGRTRDLVSSLQSKEEALSHNALGTVSLVTDRLTTMEVVGTAFLWLIISAFAISIGIGSQVSRREAGIWPAWLTVMNFFSNIVNAANLVLCIVYFCAGAGRLETDTAQLLEQIGAGLFDHAHRLRLRWAALHLRLAQWQRSATTIFLACALIFTQGVVTLASVVQRANATHGQPGLLTYQIIAFAILEVVGGALMVVHSAALTTTLNMVPSAVGTRIAGVRGHRKAWAAVASHAYAHGNLHGSTSDEAMGFAEQAVVRSELGRGAEGSGNSPIDAMGLFQYLEQLHANRKLGFTVFGITMTGSNLKSLLVSVGTLIWSFVALLGKQLG